MAKPQITCFCKSKMTNTHSAITRGSKCRCFTKGKRYSGVTTVDIHKVKSIVEYLGAYKR
jgi:hypothetical protein